MVNGLSSNTDFMSKAKLKKYLLSLTKVQAKKPIVGWNSIWSQTVKRNSKNTRRQSEVNSTEETIIPKTPVSGNAISLLWHSRNLCRIRTLLLMLYYVEQGCSLTAQFGDYEEPFYTALENNFNKAVKFIAENGLTSEFTPRIKKMIESVECCGYGFPDTLWDMYYEYVD